MSAGTAERLPYRAQLTPAQLRSDTSRVPARRSGTQTGSSTERESVRVSAPQVATRPTITASAA